MSSKNGLYNYLNLLKTLRYVIILICVIFTPIGVQAQNISPLIQSKIDSLNRWVQTELREKGKIDQEKLEKMNAEIRLAQNEELKKSKWAKEELKTDNQNLITKQGMVGSAFTVPSSKKWYVKRVLVSDNSGHKVVVSSIPFSKEYAEGEKIQVPSWTAESNLLSDDLSILNYIFEIIETEYKK